MGDLSNIRFLPTRPYPCSYLPRRDAAPVYVDPSVKVNARLYGKLLEIGFQRSGHHLLRPRCGGCRACIPARIPVNVFQPSRQQRRCWLRNQDLEVRQINRLNRDEHYELYERYIIGRHNDGDLYPPTPHDFETFLTSEWGATRFYGFFSQNTLIGVTVCDITDSGLSAIYTYYDPNEQRRSLGTFAILYQIEQAKIRLLPAVYLGYWIENCRKMNYKELFRPLELFINGHWVFAENHRVPV